MCTDISNQPIVTTSGLACVTFPYIPFNMGVMHGIIAVCHNLLYCGTRGRDSMSKVGGRGSVFMRWGVHH